MRGPGAIGAALWLCTGCIEPGTFACEESADCGEGNLCEPTGFCSRPDASCPSQRRYSPYAGSGLAGSCVDAGSSTGTTSVATSMSGTASGSEEGSSTGGGPSAGELCGNGVLDADEDCDDGNRDNDDGCNSYCRDPGTPVWTVTYDDPQSHREDRAFGVAMSPTGDTFAIVGFTTVDEVEGWDILVQLYDAATGELLWTRSHGGDAQLDDTGEHVEFDPEGNLVAVGVEGTVAEGNNWWIRKYDPQGEELWGMSLDGGEGGDDKAQGVAITHDGSIVVAGQVEVDLATAAHEDIRVARLDPDGNELVPPYGLDGGGDDDQAIDVIADAQDNAYVTGWVRPAEGGQAVWTAKLDPSNAELWSDTFADPDPVVDRGVGMALAPDGSLMVAGTVAADLWVRRYDGAGIEVETITLDGPQSNHDEAADVVFTADGSFFVVGFLDFRTVGFAAADIWVRRYDPSSQPVWTDELDGPAAEIDKALAVTLDPYGAPVVAGYITVPGQLRDAWIRLYAP